MSFFGGELEDGCSGRAGEDAAVGRGCPERLFADREEVCPAGLQRFVAVADQLTGAGVGVVHPAAVDPLVGAVAAGAVDLAQRRAGRSGNMIAGSTGRASRSISTAAVPRDGGDPQPPELDPGGGGAHQLARLGGELDRVDLRQAAPEARQVAAQLHRLAADDEQRLEDALRGIGSPVARRHRGILPGAARSMLTLLIDNYDSFTYNLFQLLAEVNGREPLVVRNDEASWEELERLEFDNVVISPGPGRPGARSATSASAPRRSAAARRRCSASASGTRGWAGWRAEGSSAAPEPMHGRVVAVEHDGSPLFAGIPSPLRGDPLPLARPRAPAAVVPAEIATCDGVPMAIEHRDRPQWGVQFHPESIATEHGAPPPRQLPRPHARQPRERRPWSRLSDHGGRQKRPRAILTRLGGADGSTRCRTPRRAFVAPLRRERARLLARQQPPGSAGRFSFMGDASGPARRGHSTHTRRGEGEPLLDRPPRPPRRRLRPAELPDLPFDFDCGFVGYLGYELKAECGYASPHSSPHPDAALIFATA